MARPPDFSDKLHFRYYPARSVYQRPGQAILSKSRPNGRIINARPNGRFIKAEATGWPDRRSVYQRGPSYSQQKQAQWPFYQRDAQWVLSRQKQPDGQTSRFQRQIAFSLLSRTISLSAAGPSYSRQKQAQWPFYQREAQWPFYQSRSNRMARPPDFSDNLHFRYYPGPVAVLSMQKQPDGQTSRFQRQIAFSLLSRTISLSAAGPSYSQQKQAQLQFYQREAQWPFYQEPDSQAPDLSRGLQVPYYLAQSVYQRPGQAIFSRSKPNGRFYQGRRRCKLAKSGPIDSQKVAMFFKNGHWEDSDALEM